MTQQVRVGVVGFGWMGQTQSKALTRVRQHYPQLAVQPRLACVADTADDDRLDAAVADYGFESVTNDWRALIDREDIDLVCVTGPNFIHRDVAVAAARSGKHIWVEKPAGRGLDETRQIAEAVEAAGVHSAVGFNYRNPPAVEVARNLVASGRLGEIRHVAFHMLGDYCAHPDGALTWRFQREFAGSGVLGDLGSHGLDLAQYVVGPIGQVFADDATFIAQRPAPTTGAASHFSRGGDGPLLPVENEDYVMALLRFRNGAKGTLDVSRASFGEQNGYGFEIHGSKGAVAWDFRRMGELRTCLDQDYQGAAWTTRLVTPADGEMGAFQPDVGIAMSYDDLKVIEAKRLLNSIATGKAEGATIHDMVAAATAADAVARAAAEQRWVSL